MSQLKVARLVALLMSFAWGIIAVAVGINALVKSNDQKDMLRRLIPSNAIVNINTNDVLHSGTVITVVSGLIAAFSAIFIVLPLIKHQWFSRTESVQGIILAFLAVWLFATQIPFTVFFANNRAKISGSIGFLQLTQAEISFFERALGVTSVYKRIGYLRLLAILPWFTILFTVIAAVLCFMASSNRKRDGSPRGEREKVLPRSPVDHN